MGFSRREKNVNGLGILRNRQLFKEIDHILTKKKSVVQDVTVLSKVGGSDHRMVRATVNLPIKVYRSRPYCNVKPEYEKHMLLFSIMQLLENSPIASNPRTEL